LSTEVFRLNHEKILGDARRAADLDCLRRFFRGLCEVFEDSLTPSGAQLGAQDLWDIWRDRIEPRWKRCVQMFKAGLKRLYHDKPSKYVAGLVVALENDAAHIHDRELAMWRLKIQEAARHERFVQGKVVPDASKTMEIAATGKQGATIGEKLANPSQYPTMNLKETRQALGNVSRSKIYRWADEGKLQRAHLGRQSGKRSRVLGPVTTRGKRPPADVIAEAGRHMAMINSGTIPAERIVTIGDFAEKVYLPWIDQHKRPSTARGYRDIWQEHLKPLAERAWMRDTRTYHVQGWLDQIGADGLSRNTLKHIKSVISAIFTLAKQQDYFQGENPTRDTAVNPGAAEPEETYAYSLPEIMSILAILPELIIQRILRHANVSTTASYYIKTAADDVRSAMEKLENRIAESREALTDTYGTLNDQSRDAQSTIQ
jgi:hypothetical protein